MYTVYGKTGCSFCVAATKLLEMEGEQFQYLVLGEDFTMEQLQQKVPDVRTFPQIFLGDDLVGGYSELIDSLI